jgi:epoxide hydrolase-like predicted phosphatase
VSEVVQLRAAIFDFGGVLITPITRTFQRMAGSLGVDGSTLREVVMGPLERTTDHPWHLAERGLLPVTEIQDRLEPFAEAHGVELRGDEMELLLDEAHWSVNEVVVERVRRARDRGWSTAMLTNTFAEFRPTLERVLDLSLYDVVGESSALGARKPDPEAYEAVLARLDLDTPAEAVFLDDFGPNVAAADRLGLRTIHVTDLDAAIAEFDLLLEGT